MSQPPSLATLLVVSLLGHHPCVGAAARKRRDGSDGVDGDEADQRAIAVLHGALVALTVTFVVASSLQPPSLDPSLDDDCFDVSDELTKVTSNSISSLDVSDYGSDTDSESVDEEEIEKPGLVYVESNEVKTSWTQRARLARARKPRSMHQGPRTMISQAQGEYVAASRPKSLDLRSTSEIGVTQPSVEQLPATTSRRQRRSQAKTSCPYSDFGDDGLARQIEAMALGVEAVYGNRDAQKPKQNATELLNSAFSIMDEVESPSSDAKRTDTVFNTLVKNPLQCKTVEVVKDVSLPLSRYPLVLPRQMVQAPQKCNDMPGLTASDSMASLYSTDSISTRSSNDLFRLSPMRKSRRMSLQRNAEWAIIE